MLSDFWNQTYMKSTYLAYGVGPVLAAAMGFLAAWGCVGFLDATGLATVARDGINYGTNKGSSRAASIRGTEAKVPYATQLRATLWSVLGPGALLNSVLSALLMPYLIATPVTEMSPVPSLRVFCLQFLSCYVLGDLGLYLGHRVQHENEFLWRKFHSLHHRLKTPTAVSTIYIDPVDMLLQASLPMLLATVATQAHPLVFLAYSFARVAENTFNHTGLDSPWVRLVTLKFMPLRASVRHHDEHHRYSGYSGNAKNYGEGLWIWDSLLGTSRKATKSKTG